MIRTEDEKSPAQEREFVLPHGPRSYKWELLLLLSVAFFFHQADRAIFGVVLSEIRTDLKLTDAQLGFVGTALFATLALLLPLTGYLADVLRKKWLVTCALIFWSTTTMLTGLASGLISLILFRSVATAGGESFYAPAAYPLIARFHVRTRALAMSIHQCALYLGVMLSGFMGGYIAQQFGWRATFIIYGVAGILVGAIFIFRLKDGEEGLTKSTPLPLASSITGAGDKNPLMALSTLFRVPSAVLITIGFTAIVFVNNAYVVWAPQFLRDAHGLSLIQAGGFAMLYHHAGALAGVLIGGAISDRFALRWSGARLALQAGAMVMGAPAIVLMGTAGTAATAFAAMAVFGLFRGLYESNTHTSLFDVIPPKRRGSAVGAMTMVAFLAGSASPWVMGSLRGDAATGGFSLGQIFSVYGGAYVVGALAILVALVFTFRRDRQRALASQ